MIFSLHLTAQCVTNPPGLVAWFRANGNARNSIGAFDGVPSDGVRFTNGWANQAFLFSQTEQRVQLENPVELQIQDLTIEAWVRRSSVLLTSGNFEGGVIFAGGANAYGLVITHGGAPYFSNVGVKSVYGEEKIKDLEWHHVAVTKTGTIVRFYVDGQPAGVAEMSGTFLFPEPFAIGALGRPYGTVSYTFFGAIDEVAVYNRELTSDEISAIANAGAGRRCAENIAISVTAPRQSEFNQPISLIYSIENQEDLPAQNVRFRLALPDGFILSTNQASMGSTQIIEGKLVVDLGLLGGNSRAEITISGRTSAAANLIFEAEVTRDGQDLTIRDNQITNTISAFGPCVPAPPELVALWRGDGNARDWLLASNEPDPATGVSYAEGKSGQAFQFSGDGVGLPVGNPEKLRLQKFSIEAWIKRLNSNQASSTPPHHGVIFGGGANSYSFVLLATGELAVSQVGASLVSGTGRITDTNWHHVAVTQDESSLQFYIDGVAAGTVAYSPVYVFDTDFSIGALGASFGGFFPFLGLIDELSLYRTVLNSNQVATIYQAGSSGKCRENLALSVTAPDTVPKDSDFSVTFVVTNQGSMAVEDVSLNLQIPTGFLLTTNSSTLGTNHLNGPTLVNSVGTIPPGGSAAVVLTGRANAPTMLDFSGEIIRPGPDLVTFDNQAEVTVDILGPCIAAPAGIVTWLRAEGSPADELSHPTSFPGARFADGKVGQAFEFDGSNEVVVPDSPDLNTAGLTAEAWIYPTVLDGRIDVIVSKEADFPSTPGQTYFQIGIKGPLNDGPGSIPTGNLVVFTSAGGMPDDYAGWTDAKAAIPLRKWSHVALSVEAGSAIVYVNGTASRAVTNLSTSPLLNSDPMRLGSRGPGYLNGGRPTDRFNGRIDEFTFYGRSLSGTEIASIYQGGAAGKCTQVFPPVLAAGPVDRTFNSGQDAAFSVIATGTSPLSFQWRHNEVAIAGATNSTLVIPGARRPSAGKYGVTVCNAGGCVTSTNATLTIIPVPALIRIATVGAESVQTLQVPVSLIGNGNENSLTFSVRFDTNRLTYLDTDLGADASNGQILVNSAQASRGVLGVVLSLPGGAGFVEKTNEILRLNFRTGLAQFVTQSPLLVQDLPVARRVLDVTGQVLPANWISGAVSVAAAEYEADVSPLAQGDRQVNNADWIFVGQLVAGLKELSPGTQFQRADCAPLSSAGDGLLTIIDWVQTGLFSVGLNEITLKAGPTNATAPVPIPSGPGASVVQFADVEVVPGRLLEIPVLLTAAGTENALGFGVQFDPTMLKFVAAVATTGGTLDLNQKRAADGKIGLALALNTGARFAKGTLPIARLQFMASPQASGSTLLKFDDQPIIRELASSLAVTLPVTWRDSNLAILPKSLSIRRATPGESSSFTLSWSAQFAGGFVEFATDPFNGPWSRLSAEPAVENGSAVLTVPATDQVGFYRLRLP